MNYRSLTMTLYDIYQMDLQLPPYIFKWKREFEEVTYTNWAINEFENYLLKRINSNRNKLFPIQLFIDIANDFLTLVDRCASKRETNITMFLVAHNVMIDILDLLTAMK